MALPTYQSDIQAALQQEVEKLSAEVDSKRYGKIAKSDPKPLTGEWAKMAERLELLQEIEERVKEDPDLLRFVDSAIGRQVHTTERRQTRLAIILSLVSLIAGWLLSLLGTPANIAHLVGR